VAGLLTVFAYYACSLCITVVLAAFLAILVDPPVVILEKLRLPQGRIVDYFTKLCETGLHGFHLHFIIVL
jgi:predicted PurR-regulated permease PerM